MPDWFDWAPSRVQVRLGADVKWVLYVCAFAAAPAYTIKALGIYLRRVCMCSCIICCTPQLLYV